MPATIPRGLHPVVEGFAVGAPMGVERTEVAGGMPRYALEYAQGQQEFKVRLVLTSLQFSVWTAFYIHVIAEGVLSFSLRLDTGMGTALTEVQIVPGSYSADRLDSLTTVTFTVKAVPSVYALSEAAAVALILAHDGTAQTTPPTIPRGLAPVVDGYGFGGGGTSISSPVPGGLDGFARTHDRGAHQFRATMVLTAAQWTVWTVFLHHIAKKGAVSFNIKLDSGFGALPHLVNIIPGTYSAVRNGVLTVVSFGVEAESSAFGMTDADADALMGVYEAYDSGIFAILDRIAQFANVDTLVLQ